MSPTSKEAFLSGLLARGICRAYNRSPLHAVRRFCPLQNRPSKMTLRERFSNILVERISKQLSSRSPKRLRPVNPPESTIAWYALASQHARFQTAQIYLGASLPDGSVNVASYECHIRDVVGPPPVVLRELTARKNVVPIHVALQQYLSSRIEIQ